MCVQALLSSVNVMQRGCGRFRIDVDVSRDETYTTLKVRHTFGLACTVLQLCSNVRELVTCPHTINKCKLDKDSALSNVY
jgi:hypothetical protein